MIIDVYYYIGILVFIGLISIINKFRTYFYVREWFFKFQKVIGRKPNKIEFRKKQDFDFFEKQNLVSILESFWLILGLFTSNWMIFTLVIITSILIKYLSIPIRYTLLHKIILFTFYSIKVLIYFYLIMRHFNITDELSKFFNNL